MSSRPWVRIPPALLVLADAEHRRAHCAVTAASPTVVVRLHPSASIRPGMRFFWKNTSLAPRRSGFDSRRLHFPPRPRRDHIRIEAARRKHDVQSQRRGARSGARHDLGARPRLPHDRPLHRSRRGAEPRAHRVHLLGDRAHDARRAARTGPVQPPRPLGAGGRHRPVGRGRAEIASSTSRSSEGGPTFAPRPVPSTRSPRRRRGSGSGTRSRSPRRSRKCA